MQIFGNMTPLQSKQISRGSSFKGGMSGSQYNVSETGTAMSSEHEVGKNRLSVISKVSKLKKGSKVDSQLTDKQIRFEKTFSDNQSPTSPMHMFRKKKGLSIKMNPNMSKTMKSVTSKNSNKSSSKSRTRKYLTNSSPKNKESRFRQNENTKITIQTDY